MTHGRDNSVVLTVGGMDWAEEDKGGKIGTTVIE